MLHLLDSIPVQRLEIKQINMISNLCGHKFWSQQELEPILMPASSRLGTQYESKTSPLTHILISYLHLSISSRISLRRAMLPSPQSGWMSRVLRQQGGEECQQCQRTVQAKQVQYFFAPRKVLESKLFLDSHYDPGNTVVLPTNPSSRNDRQIY